MFMGLAEALKYLEEETLPAVFARHRRYAEATRQAVQAWRQNDGPELYATDPRTRSDSVTAIQLPEGHDAEAMRALCLKRFNVSLGGGLGDLRGRVFRIGHMGDMNEPMLLGAIAAVEMALGLSGVPHGKGGVNAAMAYLAENP
jgi:alanine-glyoxylate transaminase/serine-glyoxylate transaminase/serine-pyruvate transaminase